MDMNITYFCFLSFPGAAILNIYDAIWLPNCLQQKKNVYSEQYRQPYNPKFFFLCLITKKMEIKILFATIYRQFVTMEDPLTHRHGNKSIKLGDLKLL